MWVWVYGCGCGVLSDGEGGGGLDGVPVLLREGVGSLLQALLALGQSLVLANRHVCGMSRSCRLVGVVWRRRGIRSFDVGKARLGGAVESRAKKALISRPHRSRSLAPITTHVIVHQVPENWIGMFDLTTCLLHYIK